MCTSTCYIPQHLPRSLSSFTLSLKWSILRSVWKQFHILIPRTKKSICHKPYLQTERDENRWFCWSYSIIMFCHVQWQHFWNKLVFLFFFFTINNRKSDTSRIISTEHWHWTQTITCRICMQNVIPKISLHLYPITKHKYLISDSQWRQYTTWK